MEKNIAEMLKEEKEYFNRGSNEKKSENKNEMRNEMKNEIKNEMKNEKLIEWNNNYSRRSSERQTRSSMKNGNMENKNSISCPSSMKKKMYNQQVNELKNNELKDEATKNNETNDVEKSDRIKRESKSGSNESNGKRHKEQNAQKKTEDLTEIEQQEITREEGHDLHNPLKCEMRRQSKRESNKKKKLESNDEDKKIEKGQNRNDIKKEETMYTAISTNTKKNEKKQNILKKNESASAPASTKKVASNVHSKYSVLKKLSNRSGNTNASAVFNMCTRTKSAEGKKKNEDDSSLKQNILDVLSRRVKCLTTIESVKEYEFSNIIKYRLTDKEGVIVSTNDNKTPNRSNVSYNNKEVVLLLLTRDFRVNDNWALIYAYEMAQKKQCNLLACTYLNRKEKQYNRYIHIKLKILKHMEMGMKQLNIPFHILLIYMIDEFIEFIRFSNVKTIVCDMNPLRPYRNFITNLKQIAILKKIKIFQVDAHNIIPVWVTSNEEEMNARTIRTKIKGNLFTFLTEYIKLKPFQQQASFPEPFDVIQAIRKLTIDTSAPVLHNFEYTENKALQLLKTFCETELEKYSFKKNDPNCHTSHTLFLLVTLGILSSQRCALEANQYTIKKPSVNSVSGKETFQDQIIIKKELADNFCYFNKNYDNIEGSEKWARDTLGKHENDKREYIYEYEDLRDAKTHDDIWNCSQLQLVKQGTISGYLKLYWAKQILNWTANSQTALTYAFELYKHYSLDHINPVNCEVLMNAILGVHDIPCTEKKVFGKIRHMSNYECKKGFNMEIYMSKFAQGVENARLVQKIPTMTFATYLKKRKRNSNEIKTDTNGKKARV